MTVPAAPSPQTFDASLDDRAWGVYVAAKLAQEQGLPLGNFWEPGIARRLYERCRPTRRGQ